MRTKNITYYDDDTLLEGYLAYNPDIQKPRPGVIVAPDWSGRNAFACQKAEKLAELGYVGFAIDMFGKGVVGKTKEEKAELIEPFVENRKLLLKRIQKGYETLSKMDVVDTSRMGAIGFCFGGMCVLDLARAGTDLNGVVSFHGLLNPPDETKQITAKILALHGFDDPLVPLDQVIAFENEMTQANADWQLYIYGNAMHAFTNPNAHDREFGTVYDALADKRSWIAMQTFFTEVFF